jgi:hypothetical protein
VCELKACTHDCAVKKCLVKKCLSGEPKDCPLAAAISAVSVELIPHLRDLRGQPGNANKSYRVSPGGKHQYTKWCKGINVKHKDVSYEKKYTLVFRLDNYCPANRHHLIECLFDNDSGNPHEIRNMGYIQFEEETDGVASSDQHCDRRSGYLEFPKNTLEIENGNWVLKMNDITSETGYVTPLNLCAEPLMGWDDSSKKLCKNLFGVFGGVGKDASKQHIDLCNLYGCKKHTPNRHVNVLDLFDENNYPLLDRDGKLHTPLKPDPDKIKWLADSFDSWIKAVEEQRAKQQQQHPENGA